MSKQVKVILAAVAVLVVFFGGAFASGLFGGQSDEQMIKAALDEAVLASKEGRPGGVLEFISQRFAVNGMKYGTGDISKTIKDLRPNVEIENPTPNITGNSATIVSPVRLAVSLPPIGTTLSEVTITFAKENGTKWLIFPVKKWRMVEVDMPESVIEDVKNQFSSATQL